MFAKVDLCIEYLLIYLILAAVYIQLKSLLLPVWTIYLWVDITSASTLAMGQPCGKASWEGLVGKPRGEATDPLIHAKGSVILLLQLRRKAHVHLALIKSCLSLLEQCQK